MYIALYKMGDSCREVDSFTEQPHFLEELSKGKVLFCPSCDDQVYYAQGTVKQPHFVYHNNVKCRFIEKESIDHKETKRFLISQLPKDNELEVLANGSLAIRSEVSLGYTRPDIFLILKGGKPVGVEYQRYQMEKEALYKRLRGNTKKGVATIYLIGGGKLLRRVDDNPKVREWGELEREINSLWRQIYIVHKYKQGQEYVRTVYQTWATQNQQNKGLADLNDVKKLGPLKLAVEKRNGLLIAKFKDF